MQTVSIKDFQKLDIRIGIVLSAEKVKGSENLIILQVDLGKENRQIVAGVAKFLEPPQLVGKRLVILTNLEPRRLMGFESQGMMLAGDVEGKPYLLTVEGEVPPGTKVT